MQYLHSGEPSLSLQVYGGNTVNKHKPLTLAILMIVFIGAILSAQDIGGGISVFVPMSLFEEGDGSVTLEESIETSIGLTPLISIPVGLVYTRIDGYRVALDGEEESASPWFYGDSLMPYVMLKAHIPAGFVYLDLFGGAAFNWCLVLNARYDKIQDELSGVDHVDDVDYERTWGFGYLAGAAVGVNIGKVSIDIGATYRDVRHQMELSFKEDGTDKTYSDAELIMRGISFALTGSFSL